MALIQNEDNKCPTTKQVNDALKSMGGMFCLNEAAKDADVSPYMKSDEFEVTIGNLREYQE